MRRIDTRSREWKGKDHFNISLIERTSQIICGAVLWVIGRQFYLLLSRYMVSSRSARTYDQTRPDHGYAGEITNCLSENLVTEAMLDPIPYGRKRRRMSLFHVWKELSERDHWILDWLSNQILTEASYLMAAASNMAAFSTVIPCLIIRSHWCFNCVSQYEFAKSKRPEKIS